MLYVEGKRDSLPKEVTQRHHRSSQIGNEKDVKSGKNNGQDRDGSDERCQQRGNR